MSESDSQAAAPKRIRGRYLFALPALLTIALIGILAFGWVHGWHFIQGPHLQSNGGKDSGEPGLANKIALSNGSGCWRTSERTCGSLTIQRRSSSEVSSAVSFRRRENRLPTSSTTDFLNPGSSGELPTKMEVNDSSCSA